MSTVLSDKDVNQAVVAKEEAQAGEKTKSLEYHRQVLQSKMESEQSVPPPPSPRLRGAQAPGRTGVNGWRCRQRTQYVSPSDNIMSPCTAKLNALRNKHAGK